MCATLPHVVAPLGSGNLPSCEAETLRVAIAAGRQAHYRLPANAFARRNCDVCLYTVTPRSRMRGFDLSVRSHWIPAPVTLYSALTHKRTALLFDELDSVLFDRWTSATMDGCDLFLGASTSSLASGMAVQRTGGVFVLDRACPDIRLQQQVMAEEAKKTGGVFRRNSTWFVDRQVEEYERADLILSPSDYSRRSYPMHLQEKVVLAPLLGRPVRQSRAVSIPGSTFVLGAVGGHPLRKGYLYLLQAWKQLALPHAELRIRTDVEIYNYPVLNQLLRSQQNVSVVSFVPDIGAFYRECDAFILPSVDDGFGMALFEALANGVPSIATRNCGASELLEDGRDCLLINAFSVEQIQEAILRIFESADLRQRLKTNGQAAITALQEGDIAKPYEAGIDRLLLASRLLSPSNR